MIQNTIYFIRVFQKTGWPIWNQNDVELYFWAAEGKGKS